MNTDYTIKDDPAAVLRALADGRKMRALRWDDGYMAVKDGVLRNECGELVHGVFSGTWHVLKERDMGADPRVGDVVQWSSLQGALTVDAVSASHVYCAGQNNHPSVFLRLTWREYFDDGLMVPIEYASEEA
jgi:hypothetical protein